MLKIYNLYTINYFYGQLTKPLNIRALAHKSQTCTFWFGFAKLEVETPNSPLRGMLAASKT